MGFYGNITNTNRTQFVFDKIYPNRKEMDANAKADGVFVGRYVLVDYDSSIPEEEENPIEVMASETYAKNFNDDKEAYPGGIGRGWDSTVWQKTYINGEYQYVMVAELNSVVPTFDVKVDAPTINPVSPHFDEDITNVYYPLHVQPSWGFRVGETYGPSDTKISIDEKVWNEVADANILNKKVYNGDIYFNKAGFDPVNGYKVKAVEDKITILPTGKSGQKYNTYEIKSQKAEDETPKVFEEEAPDIQELRINLPSIGNAVATMWDMIYEPNTEGNERNQHIEWDNIAGVRMVEANPNGDGFTYNTDKVETLAGCINSVHDLMGMIIVNDNPSIKQALTNRIYYRNGGYYIKDMITQIKTGGEGISQDPVELTDFTNNIYYKNKNSYYLESQDTYEAGNTYYTINGGDLVEQPLSKYDYKPSTYHYKDKNNNYILDNSEDKAKNDDYSYYILTATPGNTPIEVTNHWSDKELTFDPRNFNNSVIRTLFPDIREPWNEVTVSGNVSKKTGGRGLFYVSTNADNKPVYKPYLVSFDEGVKASAPEIISTLYYIKNYSTEASTSTSGEDVITYDFQNTGYYSVEITDFPIIRFADETFYYFDESENKYECLTLDNLDLNKSYITLNGEEGSFEYIEIANKDKPFYHKNKYFYKDGVNYIYAEEEMQVKEREYYRIVNEPEEIENVRYYQANKFYYLDEDTGIYKLDDSDSITLDRIYYIDPPTQRYVANDPSGNFQVGAKWNEHLDSTGIELGYKVETYDWKPLNGFARSLNTIHGLILKINNVLKLNDKITRDTTTVQGCINNLNDIINKFEELEPGKLLIPNQYGKVDNAEFVGDNWLAVSVDPAGKTVSVDHIGPVKGNAEAVAAVSPLFGGSFDLTDHYFDDKGHKFATKSHTVTLPKGSYQDSNQVNGGKVITSLGFNPSSGAITSNSADLKDVMIAESETLGSHLAGLKNSINQEAADREAAVSAEATARENADNTEKAAREAKDNELANSITTLTNSTNISVTNLTGRVSILEGKVSTWDAAEQNAKNYADSLASNYDTAGAANNALTSAKEYTDTSLVGVIKSNTAFSYSIGEENSSKTIQEMFDYIATLEARIKALEETNSSFGTEEDPVI